MDKHLIINDVEETLISNVGDKLSDFEILTTIGKGGYGFVVKVRSKRDHKIYAMKMIDFNKLKTEDEKALSMNEIKLIQGLNSPHIIKYHSFFLDNSTNKLYIVMEFMANNDLEKYIKTYMEMEQPIPEDEVINLLYQATAGLYYCHRKNIIHRDIKPGNFFMTESKDIKIGDFGVSAAKRKRGELNTLTIGTPQYMAPEMFGNQGYDSKIDIYALGCSFHILCYFALPRKIVIYNDMNGQHGNIEDIPQVNFKNWNFYSDEIKNLIYKMIDRNPITRPSSEALFSIVKEIYNRKNKQNTSIACAYNCIYSIKNLTAYMETQRPFLSQNLGVAPVSNSFLYYLANINNQNQVETLKNLRDIITFENPSFPDPGQIDPVDIIKFVLKKLHFESHTGSFLNANIFANDFQSYLNELKLVKSCIVDFFFGTFQINTMCFTCKNTVTKFTSFYQLTFDIDQALKIGMASNNNLVNYFVQQNQMMVNYSGVCSLCHQEAYLQEKKMIFSLPYNLVILFKGEKNNYQNRFISYFLKLNLAQLGLSASPKEYNLKGIIKCLYIEDQKSYTSIYLDPKINKWFCSTGYVRQQIPSPEFHNQGDVVALFYSAA